MTTIDCLKLRTSGALQLNRILEMELQIGANRHGRAVLIGEAGEDAFEKLNGAVAGQEVRIWTLEDDGAEVPLFSGVIDTATLISVGGYSRFQIELSSGTSLMDRQKRNRSFQNVNQTYEQIVEQVVSAYAGGFAICTIGCDAPIGTPLIQYGETDWEFLMRIASQLGGVLVPEVSRGLPRMWFGFPDRSYECTFPEHCYTSGLSPLFFENGGEAAGLRREDFSYYDVESPENCDIGWYTYFKGDMFLISEKSAILKKGEFLFTYRLGRGGLGFALPRFNDKISGMSLLGEVVSTSAETVSLRLDIDKGHDPGGAYPYPWRPATGNLMYCMPQVGTRVSLYFPTLDERRAMVVNCVRTNGESCERMGDPSKRAFVTEHGKELTLHPEEMSLKGGIGQLLMSDADGIKLSSDSILQIIGANIRIEAPTVTCTAVQGELVMVKADAMLPTPESTFAMSNAYQLLSGSDTTIEGRDLKPFDAYKDQPEEGEFDGWGLFGNILAGLAAVALVAVAIALTVGTGGLAGAAIIGACVVGTIAVGGKAISDYQSGTVSNTLDYFCIGLRGATAGAVCALLPGGTGMMGIGLMSVAEGLIERTIMGESTTWSDLLIDFGIGAFGFGLLDNLNRRFNLTDKLGDWIKKALGKTAKEAAEEAAERIAKEAAEETAERLAKEAAEEAAEKAAKEAAEEAAEKAAKDAAGAATPKTPLVDGPYIKDGKPHGRPGPTGQAKIDFEQAVYDAQVGADGILREPYEPYDIIDWKPGEPRTGKVDFGHGEGLEYRDIFEQYKNGDITLEQLKEFQSNPDNFRLEAPSSNRNHSHESK